MTHDAQEQPHPERLIRGARAARSLSEVLWETLEDAVAERRTARVAELSARLAEVSQTVASLADGGRRPAPEEPHAGSGPGGEVGSGSAGVGSGSAGVEPTHARARARALLPEPMAPGRVEPEPAGPEPMESEQMGSERVASEQVAPELVGSEPASEQVEPPHPHAPDSETEPVVAAALVDERAGKDPLETAETARVEPQERPDIEIRDERGPAVHEQDAFAEQEQAEHGYGEPAAPMPMVRAADGPVEQEQAEHRYGEPAAPMPMAHTVDGPVEQEQAEHGYGEPPESVPMVRPADRPVDLEQDPHRNAEPALAERGGAPWTASIERRLERYRQDGHAFALLLLELADVQRLRHAELPGEVARLTTLVETELSAHLRPADSLMRETPGRYWLLAPQTDGSAAQALAGQMTAAVGRAASHRGAPLRLAVGIAVCPRDAIAAAELVDRAEVALYEAHASGRALPPDADPSLLYDDLA